MTRRDDPRVAEVLAAFDRQASSPARDGDLLGLLMDNLVWIDQGFFADWPDAAVRAVLHAILMVCPDDELNDITERARGEQEFIVEHEAQHQAEAMRAN